MIAYEHLLELAADRVRRRGTTQSELLCPAHEDRAPSLSLGIGGDENAVIHCHAGCPAADVMAAWPGGRLPVAALFDTYWNRDRDREPEATYDYLDETGRLLFQVVRKPGKQFRQRRPDGAGGWAWNLKGTPRVLYRLPRVLEAVAAGATVYVCEGEKDVHALEAAGVTATCNPGGAGKWRDEYAQPLEGARVVVIRDRDDAGRRHADVVVASLRGRGPFRRAAARSVRLVEPVTGKDAADHLAAGRTVEQFVDVEPGDAPAGPFSLPVAEFVAAQHDAPPALIGTDDDCLLPAYGLGMIVGRGGKGKTSLVVDLALHAAAGIDWLGIPIGRPLRVLLLENEGPREMFRRKLERRLAGWEHELGGRLHVHVQSWAGFKLEDAGVAELNRACDELAIDLVIGDPLDSLGMEGEGSPSEARRMVDRLKAAGLAARRAWLLLHHPRKANDVDAVDAASGDWGGRPDLILKLEKLEGNRARLTFPKVRWGGRERAGHILAFEPDTGAFEFVAEEDAEQRDLAAEVVAFLEAHPLRTAKEIAARDAVGANEQAVRDVLDSGQFDSLTGDGAKAAGRHPSAVLWKVIRGSESPGSPPALQGAHVGDPAPLTNPVGVRGPGSPAPPPPHDPRPAPDSLDLEAVARADRIGAKFKRPNQGRQRP